jgi:hypothetical protein
MEVKLELNSNYSKVHITIKLSENTNRLLSESCSRSNRKKIQEATLRLEDHLKKFRSISEINYAISINEEMDSTTK